MADFGCVLGPDEYSYPPMVPSSVRKLTAVRNLLAECAAIRTTITARQLLAVTEVMLAGSITRAALARRINMTEGAVTRLVDQLGPNGSGCLDVDGKSITLHPESLPKWERFFEACGD